MSKEQFDREYRKSLRPDERFGLFFLVAWIAVGGLLVIASGATSIGAWVVLAAIVIFLGFVLTSKTRASTH